MKDSDNGRSTRRGFFQISAALAAGVAAPRQSKESEIVERDSRRNRDPNRRILLKGGTIVSMDPKIGDFVKGDLLIQGKKISAGRQSPGFG